MLIRFFSEEKVRVRLQVLNPKATPLVHTHCRSTCVCVCVCLCLFVCLFVRVYGLTDYCTVCGAVDQQEDSIRQPQLLHLLASTLPTAKQLHSDTALVHSQYQALGSAASRYHQARSGSAKV
jgi:hypothetical protein